MHKLKRNALALALLAASGCLSPEVLPPEPPRAQGDDRSAVLHRLADREDELAHWRETADTLRETLEETRREYQQRDQELFLARNALDRMIAERDEAILGQAGAERARRRILERFAARELDLVRREREALEEELVRLSEQEEEPR